MEKVKGRKWLLMQSQILVMIHKWKQGNLEGESGNLSEVTQGFFFQGTLFNNCCEFPSLQNGYNFIMFPTNYVWGYGC